MILIVVVLVVDAIYLHAEIWLSLLEQVLVNAHVSYNFWNFMYAEWFLLMPIFELYSAA